MIEVQLCFLFKKPYSKNDQNFYNLSYIGVLECFIKNYLIKSWFGSRKPDSKTEFFGQKCQK